MSMKQCNPQLKDGLGKYFPPSWNLLASAFGRIIDLMEAGRVRLLRGKVLPNERIVEYPLVFRLGRFRNRQLQKAYGPYARQLQL